MDKHVISGTQTLVISGTRSSWFQEPGSPLSVYAGDKIGAPNLSNIESFGFLLTDPARIHSVWKSPKTTHTTIVILFSQTGDAGKTTVALDPVGGWRRQRSRVIVIDVGRKGRKENSWLDWSKQRPKEGLTRFFRVTGLTPPAPRRDALEIACAVDHIVTGGPPHFAMRMHSALLAPDVALTPFQPSPSEEGASVEIRKLLEKAWIFRPGPHPRLILNRYGFCVLTVRERATAFANQYFPTPCGRITQRVAFAKVACTNQFTLEPRRDGHAARADDRARYRNHERRVMTVRNRKSTFALPRAIARLEFATRRTAPGKRNGSPQDRRPASRAGCASSSRSQHSGAG